MCAGYHFSIFVTVIATKSMELKPMQNECVFSPEYRYHLFLCMGHSTSSENETYKIFFSGWHPVISFDIIQYRENIAKYRRISKTKPTQFHDF